MRSGYDHPAVRVENLTVRFKTTQEASRKQRKGLARLRPKSPRVVEALSSVSFEVPMGSVYGVIGHNGAGKSTLLRTIAGILAPTEGRVTAYGRVTPLLSLGLGFNRQLSGRENIALGGLMYGLDRETIDEQTEAILEFADLGEAIDSPMRTYSSGMFARLGFAVAAHLEPEIILIDEALGAGDASFQKKCSERIAALCEGDCTVIVVTHGLHMVKAMADRCLWIHDGIVRDEGPADRLVSEYLAFEGVAEEMSAV